MADKNRREILRLGSASCTLPLLAMVGAGFTPGQAEATPSPNVTTNNEEEGSTMKIYYLEIVTPDVDAICKTYEQLHGVEFSEPEAGLGNARTAKLAGGGMLGVRAPLRDNEDPVVRPYLLVEDIEAAVAKAKESGAEIAIPPMELPGHGKFAIFIQGGIDHGLWQELA